MLFALCVCVSQCVHSSLSYSVGVQPNSVLVGNVLKSQKSGETSARGVSLTHSLSSQTFSQI